MTGLPAKHALLASMAVFSNDRATVVLIAIGQGTPFPGETEVSEYLSLHGVGPRAPGRSQKPAGPVGAALSDAASGCDLLVVGGYGHSRTIETIFGGDDRVCSFRMPISRSSWLIETFLTAIPDPVCLRAFIPTGSAGPVVHKNRCRAADNGRTYRLSPTKDNKMWNLHRISSTSGDEGRIDRKKTNSGMMR